MSISPQKQTLAATRVPQRRWCFSPSPLLLESASYKLNHAPSLEAKDLPIGERITSKLNLKPPQSISEVLPLFLIGCNFSGKLEVNLMLPVSSPCRTLNPGLYGSEIGGL
jgi:hypothetical protein